MKIIKQTQDYLLIKNKPNWLNRFFWFSVTSICGLLAISQLISFKWVKLKCDRLEHTPKPQIECQHITYSLFGKNIKTIPLSESLQGAKIESIKNGDLSKYRLVLLTRLREIPFANHYSENWNNTDDLILGNKKSSCPHIVFNI